MLLTSSAPCWTLLPEGAVLTATRALAPSSFAVFSTETGRHEHR